MKQCAMLYHGNKVVLLKHSDRKQLVIQLNPPLEKWVIEKLEENELVIEDFGYVRDYKKLKKQIKDDIDNEGDERLNKMIDAMIQTNCALIKKIQSFLKYLKEKNYQVDINELING